MIAVDIDGDSIESPCLISIESQSCLDRDIEIANRLDSSAIRFAMSSEEALILAKAILDAYKSVHESEYGLADER